MAELALQLQVQTQACHDEIGRIGAELRAILPRCAGDLGRLNVGLVGMADDTGSLLEEHYKSSLGYIDDGDGDGDRDGDGDGVADNASENSNEDVDADGSTQNEEKQEDEEKENEENMPPSDDVNNNASNSTNPATNANANTSSSSSSSSTTMTPLETLETLSTLHALQQNLSSTKSILHSVSTYDKTMSTLPSLLKSSSNLNHAVAALCTLEEGARALSCMPGGDKRREEIVQTRNKILTLLKPELLHALNKVDSRLGPLQTCVGMYNSLGRIECLMEEYVRNRPSSVHRLWFEFGKMSTGRRGSSGAGVGAGAGSVGRRKSNELEFYGDGDGEGDFMDDDDDINNVGDDSEKPSIESNRASFGEWLPTWYESVLLLLSEEQRRALVVFGPQLAPEIMAKVSLIVYGV